MRITLRNSWKRHLLSVQSNSNSKHSQNVSSKCKRHFLSLFKSADTCILNSFSVRTFESLLTIRIGHWRVKNWPKAMPKSLASVYNTNITFKNNIVVLTGCDVSRAKKQFFLVTCGLKYQRIYETFRGCYSWIATYFLRACSKTLTQRVTIICTGSEGGFRGWGQNDTSWSYPWYEVSKNVFAKAVLSLVAEFQKLLKIMPFLGEISSKVSWVICWARDQNFFFPWKVYTYGS